MTEDFKSNFALLAIVGTMGGVGYVVGKKTHSTGIGVVTFAGLMGAGVALLLHELGDNPWFDS